MDGKWLNGNLLTDRLTQYQTPNRHWTVQSQKSELSYLNKKWLRVRMVWMVRMNSPEKSDRRSWMMLMREGGRKSLTWSQIIDMGWNKASVTLRDDNRIWEGNHNHRVIHKRRNSGILWGNERLKGWNSQPLTSVFCLLLCHPTKQNQSLFSNV